MNTNFSETVHKLNLQSKKLGEKSGLSLNLGRISKEYFALAKKFNRQDQDCTAMLHLIEDIANLKKEK